MNTAIYGILASTNSGNIPEVNIPPQIDAGINQVITLPTNSVTLSGSANDPDGTIVSCQWIKISGPNTFNIVSPNFFTTSITNLVQGTYTFQLRVIDNQGAISTDSVIITVNPAPNQPPTANIVTGKQIGRAHV